MGKNQQYPSADIIYDIAKTEYENEKNRTSIIDSKAGIVITFASVFYIAVAQIVNLKKLFDIKIVSFSSAVLPLILLLLIVGSMVASFISIVLFLKVIYTKEYTAIDAKYFYDTKKLAHKKDLYSIAVSEFYIRATDINKASNDKRIKLYKAGMILLIISIGLFSVYTMLSSFI